MLECLQRAFKAVVAELLAAADGERSQREVAFGCCFGEQVEKVIVSNLCVVGKIECERVFKHVIVRLKSIEVL